MNQADFQTLLPVMVLTVWAALLLIVDLFIDKEKKWMTALLAAVGLAGTMAISLIQVGQTETGFSEMVVLDGFSTFVSILLLFSGLTGNCAMASILGKMPWNQLEQNFCASCSSTNTCMGKPGRGT
mgnify:CR=1 FL=1